MTKTLQFAALVCVVAAALACTADQTKPAPAARPPAAEVKTVAVLIETTMGNMKAELYPDKAPKTVENFLVYVNADFYTDTIFHRVIPGFMIQGGGLTKDMQEKPKRAPIPLESRNGLKNVRGAIAMARTSDPNSATAQFFINVKDNPDLDYPKPDGHGYAVFGKVIEGMDVADKIVAAPTTTRSGYPNVPIDPIVIKRITIIAPAPAK
jgi:peptidyl-prolyl cis-trans isomerase A (cyclophilin A)